MSRMIVNALMSGRRAFCRPVRRLPICIGTKPASLASGSHSQTDILIASTVAANYSTTIVLAATVPAPPSSRRLWCLANREEFDRPSKIALLPALPVQTERAHLHTQTTRTVAAASQHSKELNHSGHFRSEAERKPAQEPDRPARVVDACSIT
jgi:hypothetical protein